MNQSWFKKKKLQSYKKVLYILSIRGDYDMIRIRNRLKIDIMIILYEFLNIEPSFIKENQNKW